MMQMRKSLQAMITDIAAMSGRLVELGLWVFRAVLFWTVQSCDRSDPDLGQLIRIGNL